MQLKRVLRIQVKKSAAAADRKRALQLLIKKRAAVADKKECCRHPRDWKKSAATTFLTYYRAAGQKERCSNHPLRGAVISTLPSNT